VVITFATMPPDQHDDQFTGNVLVTAIALMAFVLAVVALLFLPWTCAPAHNAPAHDAPAHTHARP